jgi:hypothetical protein
MVDGGKCVLSYGVCPAIGISWSSLQLIVLFVKFLNVLLKSFSPIRAGPESAAQKHQRRIS